MDPASSSSTISRRASVVAAAADIGDVEHGHHHQHQQHQQQHQQQYDDHHKKARPSPTRQQQQRLAFALLLALLLLGAAKWFWLSTPTSSTTTTPSSSSSASLPYTLASNGPQATGLAIGVISGPQPPQQRRVRLLQETWFTSLDPHTDGVLVFSDGTDASVPAVGISGTGSTWQGAQDRWLPAVSYLSMAFPKAEWYVLVDDDTFLIPKNLKAMLLKEKEKNKHNEEEEIYVGRTMFLTPQEGRLQGQMLPFAHGGSGVVLSAALVREIVPLLMEVLVGERERCQGTGYGDGDLGVCVKVLRGVSVRHEACLHSVGPKGSMEEGGAEGGGGEEVGWFGDGGRPCSFHYAFGEDRERGGEGGREEGRVEGGKDGAGDEQILKWHRRYNLEEGEDE